VLSLKVQNLEIRYIKMRGLQVKKGRYVIVVPTQWTLARWGADPDELCLHVAKETFGKYTTLVSLDDELYADAVAMLEKHCEENDRQFDLTDPVDMVVDIDLDPKYVRIADTRNK